MSGKNADIINRPLTKEQSEALEIVRKMFIQAGPASADVGYKRFDGLSRASRAGRINSFMIGNTRFFFVDDVAKFKLENPAIVGGRGKERPPKVVE